MSERTRNALLAIIAALAIAAYVAMGGDGDEHARHGEWMGRAAERGEWVMW